MKREELKEAIESSSQWWEVMAKLGRRNFPAHRRWVADVAERNGISVRHLGLVRKARGYPASERFTDEQLIAAVKAATSYADLTLALGYRHDSSAWRAVEKNKERLGLDTTHFTQRKRKGKRG